MVPRVQKKTGKNQEPTDEGGEKTLRNSSLTIKGAKGRPSAKNRVIKCGEDAIRRTQPHGGRTLMEKPES